jgi:hypothetical protein
MKAKEMSDMFDDLIENNHLINYDELVFCILSHGAEGSVYGIDGKKINVKALLNRFKNRNELKEKFKLFIMQMCRGDKGLTPKECSKKMQERIEKETQVYQIAVQQSSCGTYEAFNKYLI